MCVCALAIEILYYGKFNTHVCRFLGQGAGVVAGARASAATAASTDTSESQTTVNESGCARLNTRFRKIPYTYMKNFTSKLYL